VLAFLISTFFSRDLLAFITALVFRSRFRCVSIHHEKNKMADNVPVPADYPSALVEIGRLRAELRNHNYVPEVFKYRSERNSEVR
jgi:hypothetical protein